MGMKKVAAAIPVMFIVVVIIVMTVQNVLAEPYRHQKTGLLFPDPVGTMKLVRATDYEPLYAGLGTGISYRTQTIRADVFLYDLVQGPIPDGISSPIVSKEFDQASGDIYSLEKQGTYRNVSVIVKKETVAAGGHIKFLHSVLTYEQNNIKLISHLYLTGYRGFFMKLRITYFQEAKASEEANLAAFLAMIGDITRTSVRP
ncbi:MAG: hypothetical protein KA801_17800 [Syntrophorhabdaceae bacterium]|nr:hypothetical protein [Syntrophorhabdaceae bacterium]